jgi:hypothetical protein
MMPAFLISAAASMMPEPQMPRPDLFCRILGMPAVEADYLEADIEGVGVDADAFDGSRGGTHAELDVCSFQGRAGCARG